MLRHAIELSGEDWHLKREVVGVFGLLFADGGRSATAVRRSGAAANCAALKNRRRTISGNIYLRRLRGSRFRRVPPFRLNKKSAPRKRRRTNHREEQGYLAEARAISTALVVV